MAKNKQKLQRARVLGGFTLDGIEYKPNDVIESDPKLIASLAGSVDPSDEAVEHCLNELDVTIKKHPCSEKKTPADSDPDADADPDADPDTDPGDPNTEQPSA